ncbi:MAG: DUF4349 domain-containing protein, partial [Desulfosalsimonadaceae bacterium]|nr:DUF4349 domain-containing protein [Desulfosalsimonadaceae bacterium]
MRRKLIVIEICFVCIILGLLAALVAPRMFSKVDIAKHNAARLQREILSEKARYEESRYDNPNIAGNEKLKLDRKIIKEGHISFETSDIHDTRIHIDELIHKNGGYISKEDESGSDSKVQQDLTIRIPSDQFDIIVSEIARNARKLDDKNIETRDVTEEYFDIELRVKVKKEVEDRHRNLLSQAKSIDEVLAIEKRLGELRAEIESMEGKLKYLQDRVVYSTLQLTFYEKQPYSISFYPKFRIALVDGWSNFISL